MLLKNNLNKELKNYNYVLGFKLILIYLNMLKNKYSDDVHSSKLLSDFFIFLTSISDKLENVKNGFNILNEIMNIDVIIDLLCFFNPANYDLILKSKNI